MLASEQCSASNDVNNARLSVVRTVDPAAAAFPPGSADAPTPGMGTSSTLQSTPVDTEPDMGQAAAAAAAEEAVAVGEPGAGGNPTSPTDVVGAVNASNANDALVGVGRYVAAPGMRPM